MDKRIGPEGTVFEFEDGTSEAVKQRTIQRHYGTTPEAKNANSGAAAWAEQSAGVTADRSLFARWGQDFSDTFNRSWIAEGWRAGLKDTADYIDLTQEHKTEEALALMDGVEINPARIVSRLLASGYVLHDNLTGKDSLRPIADDMIEREKSRRAAFTRVSEADPWYREEGIGGKILHGGAALTSTLAAAALDPVSYVTGGNSIWGKMAVTGAATAASDVLAQSSGVDAGVQDEYSVAQTGLSFAAGAGFQGLFDGAGRLMSRKPGTVVPDRPDAIIREELDAADLLDSVPLTTENYKPLALAERAEAEPRLTMEEPGPGKSESASGPDAPEPGRQLELFDEPTTNAGPDKDPWADVDWNDIASPARKEAAVKHWEALKKFIKPEDAQRFVRWLGGETVEREGNHWNKDFFDFNEMRANPEQFEELADVLAQVFKPLYEESGNITKTWASVAERQQMFGIKMSDAIKAHADITSDFGVSAKIHALETIAIQHTDNLAALISTTKANIKKGDFSGVGELASAVQATALFDKMASQSKSEVARALNIMKASKQRTRLINDLQSQMDALNESLNGNLDPNKMGDVLDSMDNAFRKKGPKGLADEIRKARKFGLQDYLSYYIVVGLLTTPATFMRNVLGSGANAVWSVSDRYVAAAIGQARTLLPKSGGSLERVTFREANAYAAGVQTAMADALAASFKAFKQAAPVTDGKSSVMADGATFMPFEINDTRKAMWKQKGLLAVPDMVGAGVFSTIRTLGIRPSVAMDEFTKVLTRRMQLGALAHREASYRTARLTDITEASKVYHKTVDAIMNEPSAEAFAKAEQLFTDRGIVEGGKQVFQDDLMEEAALVIRSMDIRKMTNDHAREMAFQKIGPKMTKLEQAIGQWPIIKSLYVPFFRTPVALLRNGMFDHNPILSMMMKDNREKLGNLIAAQREIDGHLQRGGADADMVLARMTTGAGLMAFGYGLWNAGQLTGNLSKAEREDGKQPYSVKIGDTWYSFAQLSPLAEPLGFMADLGNAFRQREMDDDHFEALVGGVLTAFTQNVVNKSFLKGVNDLMDMFDGGQPGQKAEGLGSNLAREATDKLSGIAIPAIVRNVAQDVDPVWRETDDLIQMFIAKIPFVSETLPAKRDWLGNEVVREEGQRGIFQAIRSTKEKEGLLEREIAQLSKLGEFDLSTPSRRFNDEEITRDEQGRVLAIQGQEYRNPGTGLNMEETLRDIVASDAYASWSDARRGEEIRDTVSRFRKQANVQIRTPSSPHYMPEMIQRTGMAKIGREADRQGWTPEQARGRARRYGLTPEAFDGVMNFQPTVSGNADFLNGESPPN